MITRELKGKIVAIASSTGGPKALQAVIPLLPENLNAPVLMVQHMPAGFTKTLADKLDKISKLKVKEAEEGDLIEKGHAYLSVGGRHMLAIEKFGKQYIHYTDVPTREGVRPCANYMYESLMDSLYSEVVCVVMTGMGADGTEGIGNLKTAKHTVVIAQSAETCTVYGMPRSLTVAGLTDKSVPLEQIADEITKNVGVI